MCLQRRLSPKQTTACLHFHCAAGFDTQRLARMLHSLVRVSRRVGCSHLNTNNYSVSCDRSPVRADSRHKALQAVPSAVPKRPEAAQTQRAYTASFPQSPADFQTDGYTFSLEKGTTYPTALISHVQLLLASSRTGVQRS